MDGCLSLDLCLSLVGDSLGKLELLHGGAAEWMACWVEAGGWVLLFGLTIYTL